MKVRLRDLRRKPFLKKCWTTRVKAILVVMVSFEEIFIEIEKTSSNVLPVKNNIIKRIFNRDNSISSTTDDIRDLEEFRIGISIREPFVSRFLFPKSFRSFEPRIQLELEVFLMIKGGRSLVVLLERSNLIRDELNIGVQVSKVRDVPILESSFNIFNYKIYLEMRRAINREIPRIVDNIKSSFILKSHSFKFKSFRATGGIGAGIKQNRVMIRGNGSEM